MAHTTRHNTPEMLDNTNECSINDDDAGGDDDDGGGDDRKQIR